MTCTVMIRALLSRHMGQIGPCDTNTGQACGLLRGALDHAPCAMAGKERTQKLIGQHMARAHAGVAAQDRRARQGEIKNFTGIDSPYEPPAHPELRIDTDAVDADAAADLIIRLLDGTP